MRRSRRWPLLAVICGLTVGPHALPTGAQRQTADVTIHESATAAHTAPDLSGSKTPDGPPSTVASARPYTRHELVRSDRLFG
jgi:hypothetical protein